MTPLHATLHDSVLLLDIEGDTLPDLVDHMLDALDERGKLAEGEHALVTEALAEHEHRPYDLAHGVGVLRIDCDKLNAPHSALIRPEGGLVATDGVHLQFVWIVMGPGENQDPTDEELEPFGWMLKDEEWASRVLGARTPEALLQVYEDYLAYVETPPERHDDPEHLPDELKPSGRLFGGVINDIKRRLPHYVSDYKDGLHPKALASTLFLYFACFAPAVAFGGLLSVLTGGALGAVEMIVATAVCGVVYALFSGQPLTILGSTGPVIIFMGILYGLTERLGIPYLATLAWVGIWTSIMLIILSLTEASRLIRFFTRFTDETFAALISLIFIAEALKDTFKGFGDSEIPYDTALLSLVLALGTYMLATQLSQLRKKPYMTRRAREFIADFGPSISIVAFTGVAFYLHPVALETLDVPKTFSTTSGRPWLVNPFDAPKWVWGASLGPALLVTLLLYLDQNITVRLVNSPDYKLKKGAGYHLDLGLVGVLVGFCSIFGLPWMVAATVRSLNHVRSLATVETHGGKDVVVGVLETRVTGVAVHAMVGASLLLLGALRQVPMSVLFGLFLFMGVASMTGNQFFERLRLWVMDPSMYPPSHYLRRVPRGAIHKFTAIQAACLAVLWIVKTSVLGILFPLFIALLIPVRALMNRFFAPEHLAWLDMEEDPQEEEFREMDRSWDQKSHPSGRTAALTGPVSPLGADLPGAQLEAMFDALQTHVALLSAPAWVALLLVAGSQARRSWRGLLTSGVAVFLLLRLSGWSDLGGVPPQEQWWLASALAVIGADLRSRRPNPGRSILLVLPALAQPAAILGAIAIGAAGSLDRHAQRRGLLAISVAACALGELLDVWSLQIWMQLPIGGTELRSLVVDASVHVARSLGLAGVGIWAVLSDRPRIGAQRLG